MVYMGRNFGQARIEELLNGNSPEEFVKKLAIGAIIVCVAVLLLCLLSYILTALAYTTIAKRRGIKAGWLAWIPVLNYYVYGKVANEHDKRNGVNRKWHIALLVIALLSVILSCSYSVANTQLSENVVIPGVELFEEINAEGVYYLDDYEDEIFDIVDDFMESIVKVYGLLILMSMASVLTNTLYTICLYKTFESTVPRGALCLTIISFLIPMARAISLFACRKKGYAIEVEAPVEIFAEAVAETPVEVVAEVPAEAVAEAPVEEANQQ